MKKKEKQNTIQVNSIFVRRITLKSPPILVFFFVNICTLNK